MKWTRALQHLEDLTRKCADMATLPPTLHPLRVVQLWAAGDILDQPTDLDTVTVALVVDLPVDEVPWLAEPPGAQHWANASRLSRNPFTPLWRSLHAPVWNHRIVRPALLWDIEDGVREDALAALRDGRAEQVRAPEPEELDELENRVAEELAVSLRALRRQARLYREQRWTPGKLDPVADALWHVTEGYLDLLDLPAQRNSN